MITYRTATVADLSALADLRWEHWAEDPHDPPSVPKVPKPSKLDDGYGYVTSVHAREPYRNQGIGSELLRHVQAWARIQDLEFLVLWPSQRSVPFYARAGFHPGEAIEFEVRPYVG
jgi:GNAT superfamily N-acetyltransferase